MNQSSRIAWIDVGKVLTIALVLYIHVITDLANKGFRYGVIEYRLLSPIISLFFFMSGFVFKEQLPPLKEYARKRAHSLLVPFFFFNLMLLLLLLIVRIFYQGSLIAELPGPLGLRFIGLLIGGFPSFNYPTWFLTCLFSLEMMYFFIRPMTKTNLALVISMILFSIAGYMVVPLFGLLPHGIIRSIICYFWYIPEALTAIVFFQAGILVRRTSILRIFEKKQVLWPGLFLTGASSVLFTNLNHSAYTGRWLGEHIHLLNYGNYFLFYLSYLSTMIFLMCLSMLVKPGKILNFYGKNILVLLGMTGFFLHFINPAIAKYIMVHFTYINYLSFLLLTITITIAQIAICYPLISPINNLLENFRSLIHKILGSIFQKKALSTP